MAIKKGKVPTLPPKSPIDNVGLGPASQDNLFPFSADAEEKRVKYLHYPLNPPIDLRSSSFAPRHSLQAHSALGLSSVDNVGLGPAAQDNFILFAF